MRSISAIWRQTHIGQRSSDGIPHAKSKGRWAAGASQRGQKVKLDQLHLPMNRKLQSAAEAASRPPKDSGF